MIDAHAHVWTLNPQEFPWQQTLAHIPIPDEPAEAEQLIAEMDATGVSHAVLVQPSVYGWDNSYLADCLARWPSRFAGVCLVDSRSADAPDRLSYWVSERRCRGLRVNLIAEDDVAWIIAAERRPLWSRAEALGVSVSMQMRPEHAPIVVELAAAFPLVTFIVDYLGPGAFHDRTGIEAVNRLGRSENVWYKILALGEDSNCAFPFDDLWPLYERAYQTFGAERLVFGTDFPHIYKTSTYAEGIEWFDRLPFLDAAARRAIAEDNTKALWEFGGEIANGQKTAS